MFIENEQKLPSVFDEPNKRRRKIIQYFLILFLALIIITSLIYFKFSNKTTEEKQINNILNSNTKYISAINITDAETTRKIDFLPDYPSTIPAHLSDEYSRWSISEDAKIKLWNAVKSSPINEKTGLHYIIYLVANAGAIDFVLNSLCSMKFAGVPKNHRITVALDQEAYDAVSQIDEPVILLKSNFTKMGVNNNRIIDFYNILKVKPTIIHQLLLWNTEAILVDADTVFLQNPFHIFNDEADFEVQCDSKVFYRIPNTEMPVPWQVNLGFYKIHPTKNVMRFMPFWLRRMYNASKIHDQQSLRKVLKPYETFWINNDTVLVKTSSLLGDDYPNLTFRFLDPMLITNAGGLYQDGKNDWKKEAKLRKIDRPELIHFFHIGRIGEKKSEMIHNDIWFIDAKNKKCKDKIPEGAIKFKVWQDS